MPLKYVEKTDPEIAEVLWGELARQRNTIELIASENFTSPAVMQAVGTVLTNKYAEGYPGKRYYGGCEEVDKVERLAIERAKKLFGAKFANVQPHAGAQANECAYAAILKPGDRILGMDLNNGGHLTHGTPMNFSGRVYQSFAYGLGEDERLDYEAIAAQAREVKPHVIVAGASAYPRIIDFERMAEIAHEVGAFLMVDMAHIAGLVAGGAHPSPVPHADIVTTTTHKTLRGPRGGLILTNNEELAHKIDSAVFPGTQGGPLMHVIAGKAVAFQEALQPEFREYIEDVVANCARLGEGLAQGGLRLVSGGTDNHLCLVDLTAAGISGRDASHLLERVGFTANKNAVPNDPRSHFVTSGIRVGTAAGTTRGITADEFFEIGLAIAEALMQISEETVRSMDDGGFTPTPEDEPVVAEVRAIAQRILDAHPLYPELYKEKK